MSISIDSILINELEKAVNADQNDQTTLIGRSVAEMALAFNAQPNLKLFGSGAVLTESVVQDRIYGFAIEGVNSVDRTITIGPGVLMANGGAETPTAIDSSYRIGLHTASVAVDIAVPVLDNAWHVLEAQVFQATPVQVSRDILTNPATNDFTAQLVDKQLLKRVQFRTREATAANILPAVDPDWTPLYVFPLSTAAPQTPTEASMVDVRQHASTPWLPRTTSQSIGVGDFTPTSRLLRTRAIIGQVPIESLDIAFNFGAIINGAYCFAHTSNTFADATTFLEEGVTSFAPTGEGDWFYVYMAPSPYSVGPSIANLYPDVISNCVLVISTSPPSVDQKNLNPLNLPAPFTNETIGVREAGLMGILKGATADPQPVAFSTFVESSTTAGGYTRVASTRPIRILGLEDETSMSLTLTTASTGDSEINFLPRGIQTADYSIGTVRGGTPGATTGFIHVVPNNTLSPDDFGLTEDYGRVSVDTGVQYQFHHLTTTATSPTPVFRLDAADAEGVTGTVNFVAITVGSYIFGIKLLGFHL